MSDGQTIACVVAGLFCLVLVVAFVSIYRSNNRTWNDGICKKCGTQWLYSGGYVDDYEYKCLCGKHTCSFGSYREPKPYPKKTELLRSLDDVHLGMLYQKTPPRPLELWRVARNVLQNIPADVAEYVDVHVHDADDRGPSNITFTVRGNPSKQPLFAEVKFAAPDDPFNTQKVIMHVRCVVPGNSEPGEYVETDQAAIVRLLSDVAADWLSA